MDAVEFLKAYKRMCESNSRFLQINLFRTDFESIVSDTEQWAKEHPVKTRQSEFLKMYPNVTMDDDGVLYIDPCTIDAFGYDLNKYTEKCYDCRYKYWLQEIE